MRLVFILSFFIFFVSCSETEVKLPPDKKIVDYTVCVGTNSYKDLVDCVKDEINDGFQPYGSLSDTLSANTILTVQPMVKYAEESSNSE